MRLWMAAVLAAVGLGTAGSAVAQSGVEGRVGRLESEMRAVQRRVFPSGVPVEPQITAPAAPVETPGTPAGGALTDLTARVSALESSVRSVTGEVEQASYRVRQLETAFEAYKQATDGRLKALEDRSAGIAAAPDVAVAPVGDTASAPTGRGTARPPVAPRPEPSATALSVDRPNTGDPAEDGYTYGFRLWEAKAYPEAERELKAVADKYPKHRRASFAQNLLGRSYLDEGKPSLASLAFYDSYKKWPDGERAPDSLYYLAQALVKLKKPSSDVCKVYTELTDVYGGKIGAGMKADVARGRAQSKCA